MKKKIRRAARPHIPPEMQPPEEIIEEVPAQEPEAEIPEAVREHLPPETVAEPAPPIPPDFDLASAISMAQPLIDQAVAQNLSKMNLPALIQAAVKEQLQPIVSAAQERLSADPGQAAGTVEPSAPPSNHSPLNDQVISLLIQKLLGGGNSGGTDISKLADMLKGVQTIAELANAPYRQGRNDALQETNATLKLLRGIGADGDKATDILISTTGKEIESR